MATNEININYQKCLEKELKKIGQEKAIPTLLLHACCAPCSSYVLEYLSDYFSITVLFYNPNIYPPDEYQKRIEEEKRMIQAMPVKNPITLQDCSYNPDDFFEAVKGLESEPEGGRRCEVCFRLRLLAAVKAASEGGFDYVTTSLTISPLKDASLLNKIGKELAAEYGVRYLGSDFKKKNGYKRSLELSKEYDLYRQDYCGCVYSHQKV